MENSSYRKRDFKEIGGVKLYYDVSVSKKRDFIGWFLNQYELQIKEAAWLLGYLSSKEELLEKIHFVEKVAGFPKSMILSTTCCPITSFQYMKQGQNIPDVENAFYDICFYPQEDLYISLHFQGGKTCPEYAAVLEGNPMERQDLLDNKMLSLFAEMILDKAVKEFQMNQLYAAIDLALAKKDEENFLKLSQKWRELTD